MWLFTSKNKSPTPISSLEQRLKDNNMLSDDEELYLCFAPDSIGALTVMIQKSPNDK